MTGSHYRMHRGWLDHPMFARDAYCHRAAWAWLIDHAAFAPHAVMIGGKEVNLERGQLCTSLRALAATWGWEVTKVRRFLAKLEACHATATASATGTATGHTIVTICNYGKYQAGDYGGATASATPSDSQPPQEIKKEKEGIDKYSLREGASAPQPARQEGSTTRIPLSHFLAEPDQGPKTEPAPPVVDPRAVIFGKAPGGCLAYLIANGVAEKQARDMLGKWRRDHGDAAVIEAVSAAGRESVSEPVGWITKALASRSQGAAPRRNGATYREPEIQLDAQGERLAAWHLERMQAEREGRQVPPRPTFPERPAA
jgi:hypothetical protein